MSNELAIINVTTRLRSRVNEYFELEANAKVGDTFTVSQQKFVIVTKEAAESYQRVRFRQPDHLKTYYSDIMGCLMVEFKDIVIGIENDGYAHS